MGTLVAVTVSAAAFYVSTGLGRFWPAAWIAPIPVLVAAFRSSRRAAALGAFAAYFLGSLNLFGYLRMVLPPAVVIGLLGLPAVVFAGAVLAARLAARRLPPWAAVFAFPAAWTAYEFAASLVSPHGTALSLAYSQTDFLPLLQIASATGIWGITFLLMLAPSAVAVAYARRDWAALVPALAMVSIALVYGLVRLQTVPDQPAVRVGLAATDRGIGAAFATDRASAALSVARAYADRAARLAADGAQVVVLPEKFVGVTPADSDAIRQVFSEAARAAHVTLIAGFNRFTPPPPRNVAEVFGPDGRLVLEYDKHHMLPGPETGYVIGAAPGLFPSPGAQWGVAICKDMDFPAWSRRYAEHGVRILAVPAWDFVVDAHLHSRMAVVRGVEEGFSIARVAQQGSLTVSDACGRILAEAPSSRGPEALLAANVPAGHKSTPYTRWGDWFGWVSILTLLSLLTVSLRRRGVY